MGNVVWGYVEKLAEGRTQALRLQCAWVMLKAHYKVMKTKNRLQSLTLPMVNKENGNICLRAKGADTRNWVPFVAVLAQKMHERSPSARTRTIVACASALLDFYMIMSLETYDVEAGKEACRICATLYSA